MPYFCEHCDHVCGAMAEAAGFAFERTGRMGSCRQRFTQIVLPINATMLSVVQALWTAAQHEPPLSSRQILNRPVQLNPGTWPQSAA